MRKLVFTLLLLQGCVTAQLPITGASDRGLVYHAGPEDFASLKSQPPHDRITIIEVGAVWCRPCREVKPKLESLARAKQGLYQVAIVEVGNNLEFLDAESIHELPAWYIYLPGAKSPIRTDGPMLEKIEELAQTYPQHKASLIAELESQVKKARAR